MIKKILLLGLIGLMGLWNQGVRAQDCDTVTTPWWADFSYESYNAGTGFRCWTQGGDLSWGFTGTYSDGAMSAYADGSEEHREGWLVSQPIALGADSGGMKLFWCEHRGGATLPDSVRMWLMVLVTTEDSLDLANCDTIYSAFCSQVSYTPRSVSLAAYAGQTIRLAFHVRNLSLRYRYAYFSDISVRSEWMPLGNMSQTDTVIATGDTVTFSLNLSQGDIAATTYTWHSTLLDSTWVNNGQNDPSGLVYGTPGVDTVSVTAVNPWGTLVLSTTVRVRLCNDTVFPFLETFDDGGLICWQPLEGSNWQLIQPGTGSGNGPNKSMVSSSEYANVDSWIVSKAIALPADTTVPVVLSWDVSATHYLTYYYRYFVLVSTGDWTDRTTYDTVYADSSRQVYCGNENTNFESRTVSLNAYRGQTIHVAFCNHPLYADPYEGHWMRLNIDNVEVRDANVPRVALVLPDHVYSGDSITYAATLIEGNTAGLTYTWHSTLMDSTMVTTAPVLTMAYTLGGTDTMMVIVSNAYGADTATATVSVTDCTPIATLPWEEDFNNVAAVARNAANGKVPNCWNRYWSGSDAKYTPHVISNYPYNPISGYFSSSNHALLLQAGTTAGYDSVAMVESPAFDVPLNGQLLSFYYMYESASSGTLSVGYLHDGAFVGVADMEPQVAGRTDTVSLQAIPTGVNRFALQWKKTGTWYGVIVDDLRVFARDTLPTVRIEAPTQIFVGDPTTFRAVLYNGLTDGLTYTWHSSLTGASWSGTHEWNVTYNVGGYDTVSVIATNAYGTDTAWAVVYVDSHPLPLATLTAPTSVYVGDSVTVTATVNDCSQNGLAFSWHSSMLDTTITLNSSFITLNYTAGGTDTVTFIVSNAYGADTVEAYIYVVDCNGATVPYVETFEGVTPTAYNIIGEGHLPLCWEAAYNGTNANIILPKVVNSYQFITGLPDNALLLIAGGGSTHSSWEQVVLPRFNQPLHDLSIAFDYRFEAASRGTLSVGYLDSADTFVSVADMTPHAGSYRRDTVSLASVTDNNARLALRWSYNTSYYAVAIDNIEVFNPDIAIMQPVVALEVPDEVNVYDTVVYTAHLQQGDSAGLTYTWHSTLLDTTIITLNYNLLSINYPSMGVDTVTVTATNGYGSYTTTAIVTVGNCNYRSVPYFEDFEDVPQGQMPECWTSRWTGSASNKPRVIEYAYSSEDDRTIRMIAGLGSSYGNGQSTVVLPGFDHPLNQLSLALDYYQDTYYGTLTVGYLVDTVYTPLHTLPRTNSVYYDMRRDTIDFSGVTAPRARMAIRFTNPSMWDEIYLDNIEVFSIGQDVEPPVVALYGPSEVETLTDVTYTAILISGDTTGLTYTWHSTLLDSTMAGSSVQLFYDTIGVDTLSVIATTAIGVDTALLIVTVNAPSIPDTLWRTLTINMVEQSGDTPDFESLGCYVEGAGIYLDGDTVTVIAHDSHPLYFAAWVLPSGDVIGYNYELSLVLTSDTVLAALYQCHQDIDGPGIENYELNVSPNPATTDVTISVSQPSILTVIDFHGRTAIPSTPIDSSYLIRHSSLPAGTYFVHLVTDTGVAVKKLILQ